MLIYWIYLGEFVCNADTTFLQMLRKIFHSTPLESSRPFAPQNLDYFTFLKPHEFSRNEKNM